MTAATLTALIAALGALLGAGVVALVRGVRQAVPSLEDGLGRLDTTPRTGSPDAGGSGTESGGLGTWAARTMHHHGHLIRPSVIRTLQARNIAVSEFLGEKVAFTAMGAILPAVVSGCLAFLLGWTPVVPVAAALLGAVIGWFIPDVQLRRQAPQVTADLSEALFTYFDLVTLERLANQSSTQSLTSAAHASDTLLFLHIRQALQRAALQQRPPYAELRALAQRLQLPELSDIADVMQMEESGASLAGTLRARVGELRDAHLTRIKIEATKTSEQMTIFMVIPSLIFALLFLIPPLLTLSGSGGSP